MTTTPVTAQQILPFYLVCDESGSMSGDPIDAINHALPDLHQEIGSNPVVADKTQFCIVGFSSDPQVLLPLSDLSMVTGLPVLRASGGTSYAAAFRVLKSQIDADVARLKGDGHRVFRPVVFFLTDGYPGDADWESAYEELTDSANPLRPHIVAFGIGEAADAGVIAQVANFRGFIADGSMSPASALKEFAGALTKSIMKSGSSASADGVTLQTPHEVPGFTSLTVDEL